jgi:hypothetical protein
MPFDSLLVDPVVVDVGLLFLSFMLPQQLDNLISGETMRLQTKRVAEWHVAHLTSRVDKNSTVE